MKDKTDRSFRAALRWRQEARLRCLEQVAAVSGPSATPEMMIAAASAFEAYVFSGAVPEGKASLRAV